VDRLAEKRHRLDQLAYAGLADRSSLDLSHQPIAAVDRMLLRRLSLLDASDFAWTAAAVADQVVLAMQEGLDQLVAAHLVQVAGTDVVGQVRYRMPDLIPMYARERAVADDPESDRQRRSVGPSITGWGWPPLASALYGPSYLARLGDEIGPGSARDRHAAMVEVCGGVDRRWKRWGQIQLLRASPKRLSPCWSPPWEASGRGAGTMQRMLVLVWYGEVCLQPARPYTGGRGFPRGGDVV
jgi:hypothetical protein